MFQIFHHHINEEGKLYLFPFLENQNKVFESQKDWTKRGNGIQTVEILSLYEVGLNTCYTVRCLFANRHNKYHGIFVQVFIIMTLMLKFCGTIHRF